MVKTAHDDKGRNVTWRKERARQSKDAARRLCESSLLGTWPARYRLNGTRARELKVPIPLSSQQAEAAQKPHFYLGRKRLILFALDSPFWMPTKSCFWAAVTEM